MALPRRTISAQASKPHDEFPELPVEDLLFTRRPKFTLPPSTLEYGITITASLAHYFIEQKRSVGFVAADRAYTMIPAEHNERHENKILETLAFLEGKGNLSIAALVGAQTRQLPSGSSVILITPTIWPELLIAVDDVQRRNLRPVIILLSAESFGGRKGSDKLATQLMERDVPVCLVHCEDDLAKTLSIFSANNISQDSDHMAKTEVITLDLNFQGKTQAIAVYLIKHSDGAILIECGPGSTLPALQAALKAHGFSASDVTHVLLTHIHLDHAGSAGWWARQGAQIYRSSESARRIY